MGVTDDERRRVAERLRGFAADDSVYATVDACCVLHSIGLYYSDIDRIQFSGIDVARLADLIEPSCDRDALLALAEEMEGYADGAASGDGFPNVNAGYLWSYADRIREACGMVDAG